MKVKELKEILEKYYDDDIEVSISITSNYKGKIITNEYHDLIIVSRNKFEDGNEFTDMIIQPDI